MYFSRLKEERKRKKIKQNVLAELLGIASRNLLRYENGERTPEPQFFEKLFSVGFDVQYIITGVRSGFVPLPPEEKELLELYRNANSTLKLAAKTTLASGTKAGHVVTVNGNQNMVSVK